jgi:hypothetical protein
VQPKYPATRLRRFCAASGQGERTAPTGLRWRLKHDEKPAKRRDVGRNGNQAETDFCLKRGAGSRAGKHEGASHQDSKERRDLDNQINRL